jgi:leader peptidase (prepilin peptidase)/N-methyltransferase
MHALPWQAPARRAVIARGAAAIIVVIAAIAFLRFDTTEALRTTLIAGALITCSATDLLSFRVANTIVLPAIALTFAWSLAQGTPEPVLAVAAGGASGGLLFLAGVLSRGGLGGGDVKLGVFVGVALGFPLAPIALGAGVALGSLSVICLNLRGVLKRDEGIPFAPFIALPAAIALLIT